MFDYHSPDCHTKIDAVRTCFAVAHLFLVYPDQGIPRKPVCKLYPAVVFPQRFVERGLKSFECQLLLADVALLRCTLFFELLPYLFALIQIKDALTARNIDIKVFFSRP